MITLILGLLGSGKSTVGQLLADKTSCKFVEMDTLVLQTLGVSKPHDVSPALWKECQLEVSKDLSVQEHLVIASSGNIVENDLNMLYFKTHAPKLKIVYLHTDLETLIARKTAETKEDPSQVRTHLKAQLQAREPLYRRFADVEIDTNSSSPEHIVSAILAS